MFTFLGKVLVGFSYHYIHILSSILYSIIMVISRRIQGRGPGGPALFLHQTEAQRASKNFFKTGPPTTHLRVWMTGPPFLSEGLDLPLVIAFN